MDGVCFSPTTGVGGGRMSVSGVSGGGGGTSPRRSVGVPPVTSTTGGGTGTDPMIVRRSKSQGSHRTNRRLSKCYSMAQGSLGSEEESGSSPNSPIVVLPTTSGSSAPGGPPKSHLLLLSRQYYSFGSNVTSAANYQQGWYSLSQKKNTKKNLFFLKIIPLASIIYSHSK